MLLSIMGPRIIAQKDTYLKVCEIRFGQSRMQHTKFRLWIKSKWFGGNVQSAAASSISNLQFGGTQLGCIGLRSVPMTFESLSTCLTTVLMRVTYFR